RSGSGRSVRFLVLWSTAMLLGLLGMVMVLSSSSVSDLRDYDDAWYHLRRQVVWVALGLVGLFTTLRFDYRRLRNLARPGFILAVVLLVLVLIPGVGTRVNGSARWLGIQGVTFQPSEFAKLAVIVFGANLLANRSSGTTRLTLWPMLVVLFGVGGLVFLEPDLGTTVVLAAIVASLLFFAGLRLDALLVTGSVGLGLVAGMSMSASYRRDRLFSLFDPWNDPLNTGWQTIQAGVAISSGGLWGVGLGASRAKWGFLPFAQTDFIFAIVAEELGFLAAMAVILAYLALGVAGLSTALRAPDRFGQLLAAGITSWILIQAFVNIGAVLGLLPITGVPLPFVSYGGSSTILGLTAFGILLNIARQTP
ncbi:MAG: putative lipid II flippase FtsW, partial [Actinomycetota bacterium]|nr:putative lipid II flippase FtsW [Actinomycetota bacterium]